MDNKEFGFIDIEKIIKDINENHEEEDIDEIDNENEVEIDYTSEERVKLYNSNIENLFDEWNLYYKLETKDGELIYESNTEKNSNIDYLIQEESNNNNLYIKSSKTNMEFIDLHKEDYIKGSKVLNLLELKNNEILNLKTKLKNEKKELNSMKKFISSIKNKFDNINKRFDEYN